MKDFEDHVEKDKKLMFDEHGLCTLERLCRSIEMGKNLSSKNYV